MRPLLEIVAMLAAANGWDERHLITVLQRHGVVGVLLVHREGDGLGNVLQVLELLHERGPQPLRVRALGELHLHLAGAREVPRIRKEQHLTFMVLRGLGAGAPTPPAPKAMLTSGPFPTAWAPAAPRQARRAHLA
eukprot:CAMPEP_0118870594 /NCGR_PEP_ID=MMETSP1163-20130328/13503_1 /TAXON_ID=124430 /ORGANISM="Phaeomonas parva, Strain CCMP2877" /LENGTH=134 /DNA_ID=CAMNT_0006805611 /DNA_START=624 /DNA_END=1026 /DNA_ORIENTATION=-